MRAVQITFPAVAFSPDSVGIGVIGPSHSANDTPLPGADFGSWPRTRRNNPESDACDFNASFRFRIACWLNPLLNAAPHRADVLLQFGLGVAARVTGQPCPHLPDQVVALKPGGLVTPGHAFQPRRPHEPFLGRAGDLLNLAAGDPVDTFLKVAARPPGFVHRERFQREDTFVSDPFTGDLEPPINGSVGFAVPQGSGDNNDAAGHIRPPGFWLCGRRW